MALCARDAGWTAGACHRRSAGPVPFGRLTTAHCRAGGRGSVSATDINSGANGYRRFACSLECGFDLPAAVGAAGRAGSAVPYLGPLGAPYETWRPTVRPAAACRPPLRLRRTVLHAPVDRPQTAVANRSAAHGRAGYAWHRLRTGDAGPGGSAHLCRGRHDHVRDHPDLRRDLCSLAIAPALADPPCDRTGPGARGHCAGGDATPRRRRRPVRHRRRRGADHDLRCQYRALLRNKRGTQPTLSGDDRRRMEFLDRRGSIAADDCPRRRGRSRTDGCRDCTLSRPAGHRRRHVDLAVAAPRLASTHRGRIAVPFSR